MENFIFLNFHLSTFGGKVQWLIAVSEVLEEIAEPHTVECMVLVVR